MDDMCLKFKASEKMKFPSTAEFSIGPRQILVPSKKEQHKNCKIKTCEYSVIFSKYTVLRLSTTFFICLFRRKIKLLKKIYYASDSTYKFIQLAFLNYAFLLVGVQSKQVYNEIL